MAALLSAMVAATALGVVVPPATVLGGVLAWSAGLLLVPRLSRRQRLVTVGLCSAGIGSILWAAVHGEPPQWRLVLAANQPLIGMLAAVSFLRLVATPRESTAATPAGRGGVWQTMLGLHLFGSVINISAVDMVGERFVAAERRLGRGHLLLLSRGFSTCAFWSPFFGAAAAALTYAPAAEVSILILVGACLAVAALAISGFAVTRAFGARVDEFRGYPLSLQALATPLALVVIVLSVHFAVPDVPIVAIITISAPVLTLLLLTGTAPARMPGRVAQHAVRQLPAMGGELVLFLSAGLLVAGVTPLVGGSADWLPIDAFTMWEAWALVAVMAAVSALGLHPVISIAVSASVLAPLDPNPTLFAMSGLIAWGLQAAGGPVSGLNVVLQGRYGVDGFTLARWNLRYVAFLLAAAGAALALCQALVS